MDTIKEILVRAATSPEAIGMAANAVVVVAGLVSAAIAARWVRGNARRAKILAIAERAAREVHEEFVRALKEKSTDGSLTAEDAREAARLGVKKAIEIGRGEGIDLAREVGAEAIPRLVDWAVGRLKARGLPSIGGPAGVFGFGDPR